MPAIFVTVIIGIVCIVLGVSNMKGNISSLHSYHRSRVSEANRIPFGRKVGFGTILVGIGILINSFLLALAFSTQNEVFTLIGSVIMIVCLVVGLGISFYAMIKYNKGIF